MTKVSDTKCELCKEEGVGWSNDGKYLCLAHLNERAQDMSDDGPEFLPEEHDYV